MTFDEWWQEAAGHLSIATQRMVAESAWDYQRQRIDELEQWVKAMSDNAHVPDWIQQSARSLLHRSKSDVIRLST